MSLAFNPQGNVAHRTDASGNVLGSYVFDAFGSRQGTDSDTDPYSGFGGQWGYYTDSDTGLQLLCFRNGIMPATSCSARRGRRQPSRLTRCWGRAMMREE